MEDTVETLDDNSFKIEQKLYDIKKFLTVDVVSVLEYVTEFQSSLSVALKKGEKLKNKLLEVSERSNSEWGIYFRQIAQMQGILNESHENWIATMKDCFSTPMNGLVQSGIVTLKNKSAMVKSALEHFLEEQEKDRCAVQSVLAKYHQMSYVQPLYDKLKANEELFSKKKQDMLKDLEYFQLSKAYEIGFLWSRVCAKQPHLQDLELIERFRPVLPISPPGSDWTAYCKPEKSKTPESTKRGRNRSILSKLRGILRPHTSRAADSSLSSCMEEDFQSTPYNDDFYSLHPPTVTTLEEEFGTGYQQDESTTDAIDSEEPTFLSPGDTLPESTSFFHRDLNLEQEQSIIDEVLSPISSPKPTRRVTIVSPKLSESTISNDADGASPPLSSPSVSSVGSPCGSRSGSPSTIAASPLQLEHLSPCIVSMSPTPSSEEPSPLPYTAKLEYEEWVPQYGANGRVQFVKKTVSM